jgi:transposase
MASKSQKKRGKAHLTQRGKWTIGVLSQRGHSIRQISNELDISETTAKVYVDRFVSTGTVESPPRKPRPLTRKHKAASKCVRGISKANPNLTARQIAVKAEARGHFVPVRTAQRMLSEDGGAKFLAVQKRLSLSDVQKCNRVSFCRELQSTDITNIFWSDEKWFTVNSYTKKTWVFPDKERKQVVQAAWPIKVLVWGAISTRGRCPLFFFDGNVNSETYCGVLDHYKKWLLSEIGRHELPNCVLQQDNARPHVSKTSLTYANAQGIRLLPNWPANSPDLNPIENMWSLMVPIVDGEEPKDMSDLKAAVSFAWGKVSQEYVHTLALSPWERANKCIAVDGAEIQTKQRYSS